MSETNAELSATNARTTKLLDVLDAFFQRVEALAEAGDLAGIGAEVAEIRAALRRGEGQ